MVVTDAEGTQQEQTQTRTEGTCVTSVHPQKIEKNGGRNFELCCGKYPFGLAVPPHDAIHVFQLRTFQCWSAV